MRRSLSTTVIGEWEDCIDQYSDENFTDRIEVFTDCKSQFKQNELDLKDKQRYMPFQWKRLFAWYSIYHLIGEPLRKAFLSWEVGFAGIQTLVINQWCLIISDHFIFYFYTFFTYTAMFFLFPKRKWVFMFIAIFLGILLTICLRYGVEEIMFDYLLGFRNYYGDLPLGAYYIQDNLYFAFRYVIFGIIFYIITLSFYKDAKQKNLEIENRNMQLSLLRSQLNPHFLLNSLNNIYSLVFQKSEKALGALETLSEMLKYSLYEVKEKETIRGELDYVHKYIAMQKIRYDYDIIINEEVDPNMYNEMIPQFILLPLIENAFKHGKLRGHPIDLSIIKRDDRIIVQCKNHIELKSKDKSQGIGLTNIKKRLELIHDNATISIDNDQKLFSVTVEIPRL